LETVEDDNKHFIITSILKAIGTRLFKQVVKFVSLVCNIFTIEWLVLVRAYNHTKEMIIYVYMYTIKKVIHSFILSFFYLENLI
jgi:hypothetical protein